jgi:membrane fusion protein, multidrug efflux system
MAIPVVAAQAKLGDLEHYLSAIGTVTPLATVTVQSRVAGQIMAVFFQEGQIVKLGQLLVQIDPRPYQVQLEQARGQLAHDTATLRNDAVNLERDRVLYQQNVIARQTLDTQDAAVQQDRGTLITDKANVDNAKLQLVYSRITAPVGGRIGLRQVDPGNIIQANTQAIAVITQLQPITVVFSIPEDDVELVLGAMKGRLLPAEAYDRTFHSQIGAGSLRSIDSQINVNTGTLQLKAQFPNQDNTLFPNQFVNVRLLVETLQNQVLIPLPAVQRSTSLGAFVYVVKPDKTVELRKVQVGLTEGNSAAVESGLSSGETVVIDGVDRLQQGSLVAVQTQPANPPLAVNVAQ